MSTKQLQANSAVVVVVSTYKVPVAIRDKARTWWSTRNPSQTIRNHKEVQEDGHHRKHVSRLSTRSRQVLGAESSCRFAKRRTATETATATTSTSKQLPTCAGLLLLLVLLPLILSGSNLLEATPALPTTITSSSSSFGHGGGQGSLKLNDCVSLSSSAGNETKLKNDYDATGRMLPPYLSAAPRSASDENHGAAGLLASVVVVVANQRHAGRVKRQVVATKTSSLNNTDSATLSSLPPSQASASEAAIVGEWATGASGGNGRLPMGASMVSPGDNRPSSSEITTDYGGGAETTELTSNDEPDDSLLLATGGGEQPNANELTPNSAQQILPIDWGAPVEGGGPQEEDETTKESTSLFDAVSAAAADLSEGEPNSDEFLAAIGVAQAETTGADEQHLSDDDTDRLVKLTTDRRHATDVRLANSHNTSSGRTKLEPTRIANKEANKSSVAQTRSPPSSIDEGRYVRAPKLLLNNLSPLVSVSGLAAAQESGGGGSGGEEESRFYYYHNNNEPPPSRKIRPFCFGHREPAKFFAWTCTGFQMMDTIPAVLNPMPTSLRLSLVGIEALAADALQPYRETLRDFSIENAPRLQIIERNAFANLTRLRVVYIFQAPRLVSFDFAIAGHHPDLAIVRIQQTGLKRWPDLSEWRQQRLLTSIDLDNNKIESLGSKPINIRAEVVNLEFNHITSIDEHVFNGSEIGALSLSGNRQLTFIHRNAFANLKNLIKLDLSSTSLTQLPAVGLHQLRILKIQENYALKKIPSIFVFPMLEEAQLTYSFHCCSFRYPKTHDPSAYEEHIRLQNEINAVCSKRQGGDDGRQERIASHGEQKSAAKETTANDQASFGRAMRFRRQVTGAGISGGATVAAAAVAPSSETHADHELGSTTPSSDFEGLFFDSDRQQPTGGGGGGATGGGNQVLNYSPLTTTLRPSLMAPQASDKQLPSPSSSFNTAETNTNTTTSTTSLKKQWLLQNIECGELVQKRTDYQNIICTPTPDAFNPCEDIMGYPVLRVAVWFVVACSICGNMSVIVVLMGIFKRLSVPKFLQLNLAIGDLFMGVYLAMLAAADITTVGTYFNFALDWQHGLGCQLAGACSLFASQLSIFTLIVITFERYYTITYSIDLNMRLQLGWAARIMLIGWLYAFASAMLPIFANINSYSKTSICLPMRTAYKWDRIFILVLLVVDSCAFLIIFICYLRMYLLILKQKTEATLKERTVAMRMALLVLTDFACWAPIIFFSSTAVFGYPLISVTNLKILIVFFYPLNSMANPFLYVLSTRQYRRDLNYLLGRWHHWRKNLFKSREDKDYSFNNNNPYGKYPIAMNAQLNAAAAVTGVADHLHGYRIPIGGGGDTTGRHQNHQMINGGGGQQVELIKLKPNDSSGNGGAGSGQTSADGSIPRHSCRHKHCNHASNHHHRHHHHHHRHHGHHHRLANGLRQIKDKDRVACTFNAASGRPTTGQAQYIIRHQILADKCASGAHHHGSPVIRTTRMISYTQAINTSEAPGGRPKALKKELNSCSSSGQQANGQQNSSSKRVKLGLVIDDQDRVSSLADESQDMDETSDIALAGSNNDIKQKGIGTSDYGVEKEGGEICLELLADQQYLARSKNLDGGSKPESVGLQQQQQQSRQSQMTRICMCGRQNSQRSSSRNGDNGRGGDTNARSKSVNWTSKLAIRRDKQSKRGTTNAITNTPSKSGQTTMTTDANTNTSTTNTSATKSYTEPDLETTATTGSVNETTRTTTTTTNTTGNDSSQRACSDQETGNGGEPVKIGDEHMHRRQRKYHHHHHCDHRHHHRQHRREHHHHHNRHRCHDGTSQQNHKKASSPISSSNQDGGSCNWASTEGPAAKSPLERITESSNTERSSTPKQLGGVGGGGTQIQSINHQSGAVHRRDGSDQEYGGVKKEDFERRNCRQRKTISLVQSSRYEEGHISNHRCRHDDNHHPHRSHHPHHPHQPHQPHQPHHPHHPHHDHHHNHHHHHHRRVHHRKSLKSIENQQHQSPSCQASSQSESTNARSVPVISAGTNNVNEKQEFTESVVVRLMEDGNENASDKTNEPEVQTLR